VTGGPPPATVYLSKHDDPLWIEVLDRTETLIFNGDCAMNAEQEKLELIDGILSKNLSWIAAADSKGTHLFAIDSAMLALMLAIATKASVLTPWALVFSFSATVPLFLSVVLIVLATFPRIKGPKDSLIYFGGIASYDENHYVEEILKITYDGLLEEIARQCHRNANVAKEKYVFVRRSATATFISFPFWLLAMWQMFPHSSF
jgi:hypothetical protein